MNLIVSTALEDRVFFTTGFKNSRKLGEEPSWWRDWQVNDQCASLHGNG
jgi:hypothetical protein